MTSLRSHVRVALALFAFGIVFVATVVYAQAPLCDGKGFCALAVPPPSSKLGQLYGTTSLAGFLNGLFTAAISIGAILAVLRIAYAGYEYMTSDAWGNKARAKEIIGDVVLGLMLLLGTYLILNQINPQLLNLNILTGVSQNPSAATPASADPYAARNAEIVRQQEAITQARDAKYSPAQCSAATQWLDQNIGVGNRINNPTRVNEINGQLARGGISADQRTALIAERSSLMNQVQLSIATEASCAGR
ncbi:hypothetical protein A3C20_03795 [Candidatus Kaiserbacteria bacterium RIFCSPHIGHO2_02_FULL_55_25]|uniref:Uncharacterized protein n=1 Tax=Candidatus Kaiserbacteria bacterium RIFCSPHIGHO2_02_FULL_55_25 TaxID=1798498 RepID=A0A1F6E7S0_9BACT|nr:MAG: hypothetical protein A2764_04060 [Candidatus Kaiserbacteria bacterium RIFCSPHIGHO2_01_FULL_55_79]OGG69617.1 MAG: hypothetical protein A3C20_03795 [Candidatus Kaiserbacteria bacterium RIFCSPHIGHO2_02_FULL_55_25]OGG76963.1 MAG: hypothetical protein A3F56_02420 [Candidatus Kaiserbacteria bacterium RIFCSPHIGHO2_12_FULL_55_13]OGG83276.1 MAG: hypothetical protein A3A42_01710 [Candidatus Kaiserbacteria bacterium RIFCSPLOWO2_01_FULL_55_25]